MIREYRYNRVILVKLTKVDTECLQVESPARRRVEIHRRGNDQTRTRPLPAIMTLDVHLFIKDKGGDPNVIRESQKKRNHSVEVVDEVIVLYEEWVKRGCLLFRYSLEF